MAKVGGNPDRNPEDQFQEGDGEETVSLPLHPAGTHCDEALVRQTIDSLEQAALQSHRDQGMSDDELRITMRASENARRALVDGKTDPCRVVSDLVRDMMQSDVDGF